MSIGCYMESCTEVVRGQCPGYHTSGCGRYYCAEHSSEGLCGICYPDKAVDAIIDRYSQLAASIKPGDFKEVSQTPPVPLADILFKKVNVPAVIILYGLLLFAVSGLTVIETLEN